MNCQECNKYANCMTLCAEAEAFVNQDYVAPYEIIVSQASLENRMNDGKWHLRIVSGTPLTKRDKQILRLLGLGLDYQEIAYVIGIKLNAMHQAVFRLRKKVE